MPTNIEEIQGFLDEYDLNYEVHEALPLIRIGFHCDAAQSTYRDTEGNAHMRILIQVQEDGAFLNVCMPQTWNIDGCAHKRSVMEALVGAQSQFKMLRFDHDPSDGEIRANIELPLEDATLTSRLFHRTLHGIMEGVKMYDRVIRRAMETGEVSFADVEDVNMPRLDGVPDASADLRMLAERAGGIDALEDLVSGSPSQEGEDPEDAAA